VGVGPGGAPLPPSPGGCSGRGLSATTTSAGGSSTHRVSAFFYRHPTFKLLLFLLPGVLWLGVVYLGSLGSMISYSFWRLEEFTGLVVRDFGFTTYEELFTRSNIDIILRTTAMAAAVTVGCGVLGFPLAYYMTRYASPRMKTILYLAVLMPLWSSYLVRALAWRQILAGEGVLLWGLDKLGLTPVVDWLLGIPVIGGPSLVQSYVGMFTVFVYLWLPFMVLPIQAALERVPLSYLEASADLGARPWLSFRRVVFPLALPGLVAGSIFTFSLTLGDFIIPTFFGTSGFFIGLQVYVQQGTAGNLPLAAAFTVVPMVIMTVYLLVARRLGAFEAL
jgi:putative spermidine/putrescine transport system permease protein